MKLKQYVVDAFTEKVFAGNPAAVCVLDAKIADELMMLITRENNLSETAFALKQADGRYSLRWFTPGGEIDLCGHATLGTAFVIMNYYEPKLKTVYFETMSGELIVDRQDDLYKMTFPAYDLKEVPVTEAMTEAIGAKPTQAFMGRDLLCVFNDEATILNLKPDLEKLTKIDGLLLQATAPGKEYDCVSRSFAPKLKVNEDPVCGSGHCHIVPYWSKVLNKKDIAAYQASARGGKLYCSYDGNNIILAGHAALFSIAELYV